MQSGLIRGARTVCHSPAPLAMHAVPIRGDAAVGTVTSLDGFALWQRITSTYKAAVSSGAATRTETGLSRLRDATSGIDFLIRTSTALQAKAKVPAPAKNKSANWKNPFLPCEEALWIQHLSDSHTLLLNKFNLVENHVLVVTRDFQPQSDALNAGDLSATYLAVEAMPQGGLAYFNHGPLSGMSQPHKHTQVVPLPLDVVDAENYKAVPVECLVLAALEGGQACTATPLRTLPFRAFGCLLPESPSAEALVSCYDGLVAAAGIGSAEHAEASYNWLMTKRWMMLVPRGTEYFGPVTVNSLGYAGTFFVRSVEEMEFVSGKGPMAVLAGMATPW